jgi:hypothetical protein
MSLQMKRKHENDFLNESIALKKIIYYSLIQVILLMLIYIIDIEASKLSWLSGVLSLLVLINFRRPKDLVVIFSSILMAFTTWALYFFS